MNGKTLISITFFMKMGLVSGHHNLGTSYFEYEENPVEISGTLTEVEIRNPHTLLKLQIVEKDGEISEWMIQWTDGNALRRRGVPVHFLKVGQHVTVHGRRHRHVARVTYPRVFVLSDGTLVRDCGSSIYRGKEYYETCEAAEQSPGNR